MARASWTGGLEFAGFPISVSLFPTVSSSKDSFKTLDSNGEPVRRLYIDTKGKVVEQDKTQKGVEVAPGQFVVVPPAGLDALSRLGKTVVAPPRGFHPKASIPFILGRGTYAVVPNPKVPGSEGPVNLIWNGLRDGDLAYSTEITMRTGSPDRIVVFHADDTALYATEFPYLADTNPPTGHQFTVDAKQAKLFQQFIATSEDYEVTPFEHGSFVSEHKRLRAEAVQAAIEGKEIVVPAAVEEPDTAPDLMAALEDAVAKAKAPPKKRAAKKAVKA